MFIEMEADSYSITRGGKPEIYIFEKVSDQNYTKEEIRIHDNTDLPFILDEAALGTWAVKDFVSHPDCFSPDQQSFSKEALFFESVSFQSDGKAFAGYKGRPVVALEWTSHYLLDSQNALAEAYTIRKIDGVEYLFIEWKSGDYYFAKKQPKYYVFTRKGKPDSSQHG